MALERIACQLCAKDLTNEPVVQRQAHYDAHFSGELEVAPSTSPSVPDSAPPNGRKPWFTAYVPNKDDPKTQNIFWYSAHAHPPPRNFTPGLITLVKKALIRSHEKGKTQRAWLCHEQAVHVGNEAFDRTWGCGYRNFLMACASLMAQTSQPMYFPLLDHPIPPGVRNLQSWIEEAWANGYDEEGAEQLKHRLVGTGKYIGTGELYVAFTYRGIPARLVDIELTNETDVHPGGDARAMIHHFSAEASLPQRATIHEALQATNAVIGTDKMPLILQHDGHSRTVIGCERCADGTINLLVFDPSRHIPSDIRNAGLAHHASTEVVTIDDHVSPAGVFHEVLHPVQTIKAHKRKADNLSLNAGAKKQRASDKEQDDNGRATFVDGSAGRRAVIQGEKEPDLFKTLGIFRLGPNMLKKKRRYQILYFPLTEPLDEAERWARRELTCLKVS